MLTYIHSAKCIGVQAVDVIVEVDISSGIGIHLVGLADAAVKESLLRTITALTSLGFRVPGKKIVINLAPADIRKNGSGYDVPIAIGILAASGQIDAGQLEDYIIMGELGLDGSVRAVPGALPIAGLVESRGMKGCILPLDAAGLCRDYYPDTVYAVDNLLEVIRILDGQSDSSGLLVKNRSYGSGTAQESGVEVDFSQIVGQEFAKRGMEIAAAGGHNLLILCYLFTGYFSTLKRSGGKTYYYALF